MQAKIAVAMVKEHVLAEHKEIELNPKNIESIKSLIKTTGRFWWWG
jgi:predicted small metal-binding protein